MNLVKLPPQPLPPPSVTAEAEDRRNELALEARKITAIATPEDNEIARNVAVEIRQHLKEVESSRAQLTRPLLDGQRMLKALADSHIAPLSVELNRLERLASTYLVEEQKRVAAEEKARTELASEAKSMEELQSVIAMPIQEESRARGQQLRKVMRWEVTDIHALYADKPACVRLEPSASAIQTLCVPEMPTPGLKCWWENVAVFTTR